MQSHAHIAPRRVRAAVVAAVAITAAAINIAVAAPSSAATAPTAPGSITVTNLTYNSATLTWGSSLDPLGIVGYQIYRQGQLIATTDGGVTHYNAAHLYANTSYTFDVRALDTSGAQSLPASVGVTTPASTATSGPQAPSNGSVTAHPFSDGRIDVLWGASPSTDVSGYLVLRDDVQVGRVDLPGGLRFSDNGLQPASTHIYKIEAVDAAGTASAPTTPARAAMATTLAANTVQIARGPYVSNATATSAIVSWWTNIPTTGEVDYGPSTPSTVVTDPSTAYQHAVTLTGLTAGTTYQYTVGTSAVRSVSASFRTAATPGTTFCFAAIGDFGGASPGETQNATNIATAGTSFIQTLGDNIYPSAGHPDPDFPTTYSDFDGRMFKQFGPALRSQALFPANGNQEYYSNGAFWSTFPMPGSNHSWYSYNWGNAHISVLDTELDFAAGSPEYNWLQSDLTANQGATWRIVIMQRPPYSSSSTTSSSKNAQKYLVPLFQQQHVALVLSGNSHNYERSFPLVNGAPATGGITYIVSGGGGNGHNSFTTTPEPAWSATRDSTRYEYAKVTVSPTSITVDAIDAATDTVFDTTTIQSGSTTLAPTSLAINPKPGWTYAGSPVTLTGTLTRSDTHAAVAGQTVHLQYRPAGSTGAYTTAAATATSSSTGAVSFSNVVVSQSTEYVFSMAQTATYAASTSAPKTVVADRRLTAVATPASVPLGHTFTISGKVTPSAAGATIYLQRLFGTTWSTRASMPVSSTSTYSFVITAPARGTLTYRTWVPKDASYGLSISPVVSESVT